MTEGGTVGDGQTLAVAYGAFLDSNNVGKGLLSPSNP